MKQSNRLAAAITLALWCTLACADPGYYLVSGYEDEGNVHLDYRYWTIKHPGSDEVVWPEIGIGYGVTTRWYTELYLS